MREFAPLTLSNNSKKREKQTKLTTRRRQTWADHSPSSTFSREVCHRHSETKTNSTVAVDILPEPSLWGCGIRQHRVSTMEGGWLRDLSVGARRASLRRASVRRASMQRASLRQVPDARRQSSIYENESMLRGSGMGFTRILSRRYADDLGPTPAFGSSGDTAAEAAAEAREFVQALQAEELDTEKLMHLINTPIPLLRKELSPEHLEHALRFKKTFAKLSPDFAADGILTEAELLEIKTRSWAFYESSSVLGQLDVTSKRSSDIIDTVLANTYRFLRRRSQYLQCFYFVCLIGLLVGVLSLQKDVVEAYKLREAVTTALFPADTFGEKVLLEADTKVASADSIFDWFQQVFLDSDDAVLKDPECGDGICASPVEFSGWGHGDFQFGCMNDCGSWEHTTNVHVHLSLDPSLPQGDIDEIRWNIFCTDIKIFEKEMSLFPDDQVCQHPCRIAFGRRRS